MEITSSTLFRRLRWLAFRVGERRQGFFLSKDQLSGIVPGNAYQRRPPETKDVGLNAPNIVFPIRVECMIERGFEEALIKSLEEKQRIYEEGARSSLKTTSGETGSN